MVSQNIQMLNQMLLSRHYDYSNDYIDSTCLNCDQTDLIPDFIYDECSTNKYHFKLNKKVPTLECGFCGKEAIVPSSFLKN